MTVAVPSHSYVSLFHSDMPEFSEINLQNTVKQPTHVLLEYTFTNWQEID